MKKPMKWRWNMMIHLRNWISAVLLLQQKKLIYLHFQNKNLFVLAGIIDVV